jgi:hypothetical protein
MANLTTQINTQISAMLCGSVVFVLTACGGGGGDTQPTNTAAPASTVVDLSDSEQALKVSSILLGSSPLGPTFVNRAWSAKFWEGATRTETRTCGTATFTNSDGVLNAGDSWVSDLVNCPRLGFNGVTYSYSDKGKSVLSSISDSTAPELAAWTARQTDQSGGSSNWTIFVTSNNYRYEGSGTYAFEGNADIAHIADGSQRETRHSTTTAKGTENGFAYDYAITGSVDCNYAATTKAETCSNAKFTLTGTISGKAVNAVLTQPSPNITEGVSTYEITQGTQKITATFPWSTEIFTIVTASGTALGARYVNLMYINGY